MFRIKELREKRGLTMAQLSRLANVAYATLWAMETKPDHVANTNTLSRIANVLEVPIGELFSDSQI